MDKNLKCFISSSHNVDTSHIKNILAENSVQTFDLYDFSVGDSIQQILKRKIKEADFAIFIITDNNPNVIYEMGVCEGLGKQHFILLDKDLKIPFYIQNKLFIRTDVNDFEFTRNSISKLLLDIKKKTKPYYSKQKDKIKKSIEYHSDTKSQLRDILSEIQDLRNYTSGDKNGGNSARNGFKMEDITAKVFNILKLNYVENNTNKDKGIDFALWSDNLGKILGNPIIFELKYGRLNRARLENAENQIRKYIEISDAKVGVLLYLDRENKRHKIKSSLSPLIFSYDLEDFVNELIETSFETLMLNQRNKIAHGLE
ncbi:hypothetical protein [Polaribacter atrinae]|uniref:CD-NTase-associated protein 12/Pycsar effector protein TIR domain-containing protein n=1 Tax=Polaribacter atrinae TaxID=1333662 RepID=A0A176T3A9_9FLAO|nr:hypothetical protein [Polaribacter atrinae]OAD42368.1 hypothetical protein LPB303_14820 [Polaribacter atrinae]